MVTQTHFLTRHRRHGLIPRIGHKFTLCAHSGTQQPHRNAQSQGHMCACTHTGLLAFLWSCPRSLLQTNVQSSLLHFTSQMTVCACTRRQNTIGIGSQSQTQAQRCGSHQKQPAAQPGSGPGLGTCTVVPSCCSLVSPSCSATPLTVGPSARPCFSHPTSGLRLLTSSPSGTGCPALVTQPCTDAETPNTHNPRFWMVTPGTHSCSPRVSHCHIHRCWLWAVPQTHTHRHLILCAWDWYKPYLHGLQHADTHKGTSDKASVQDRDKVWMRATWHQIWVG